MWISSTIPPIRTVFVRYFFRVYHNPVSWRWTGSLLLAMLPLLMMRHRRIPRSKWRDCETTNGKHWIEQVGHTLSLIEISWNPSLTRTTFPQKNSCTRWSAITWLRISLYLEWLWPRGHRKKSSTSVLVFWLWEYLGAVNCHHILNLSSTR